MLTRLLDVARTPCPVCDQRFVRGLGYGLLGSSACSARCRRLQLSLAALPGIRFVELPRGARPEVPAHWE